MRETLVARGGEVVHPRVREALGLPAARRRVTAGARLARPRPLSRDRPQGQEPAFSSSGKLAENLRRATADLGRSVSVRATGRVVPSAPPEGPRSTSRERVPVGSSGVANFSRVQKCASDLRTSREAPRPAAMSAGSPPWPPSGSRRDAPGQGVPDGLRPDRPRAGRGVQAATGVPVRPRATPS